MVGTNTELAWAAGFFDGEGSTWLHKSSLNKDGTRSTSVRINVGQKDLRPLTRFHSAVGGLGYIYRKGSGMWQYQVARKADVHQVIWALWPYLSEPKQEQISKCC